MHNNQNNHINGKFQIEERRRKVAALLAQSMTETEIAKELGVDQSTISRDIKVLKELSQRLYMIWLNLIWLIIINNV